MSGSAPRQAPRRPQTARPRQDVHRQAAPSRDELEAVERQMASLPVYSGARLHHEPQLGLTFVHQPGHGPGLNFAACIRWPSAGVAERLRQLHEQMHANGEWPALVVTEGLTEPTDLPFWLESNGWVELERERVFWTRHPPVVPHLDPSLRVEAVTARSADEFERVERLVFGLAESRAGERREQLVEAIAGAGLRAYLVRLRGEAVATTRLATGDGVAGIFGVAVAPEHRRRGYGSLVTAIATRAGLASGNRLVWLSVDEQNTGAVELYRKLGYHPSFAWIRWIGSAANDSILRRKPESH